MILGKNPFLSEMGLFANYWRGGDDFRNYGQKRRDKKRVFVHKIRKRSGFSKVKCILIFILVGGLY